MLKRRTHKKVRRQDPPEFLIQKQGNLRFPAHLKWVRQYDCILHKTGDCQGPIEAVHYDGPIPNEDRGGKGVKDHDKWTFPGCAGHHRLNAKNYHSIGYAAFEKLYKINTKAYAEQCAKLSPHRHKWEQPK